MAGLHYGPVSYYRPGAVWPRSRSREQWAKGKAPRYILGALSPPVIQIFQGPTFFTPSPPSLMAPANDEFYTPASEEYESVRQSRNG